MYVYVVFSSKLHEQLQPFTTKIHGIWANLLVMFLLDLVERLVYYNISFVYYKHHKTTVFIIRLHVWGNGT